MAVNPFEMLRLPPSAGERDILLRVRRPYPGADPALLQQAAQEVRFSMEKRALYEMETFHAPDYQSEIDDSTAEQLIGPLEAFASKRTLSELSAQLLDYLACNLANALPSTRMPNSAQEALTCAQNLAQEDVWLLHDLGLLCQRHLQMMWDEQMQKRLSRGQAKNLEEIAQLYLACQLQLTECPGFAAQLEAIKLGGSQVEAEAAISKHFEDQLDRSEQMLASAVNNDNEDVLRSLAAGWFDVLSACKSAGHDLNARWPRRLDEMLNSELNRHREKVKTSGIEREGVSGKHEESLAVMFYLLNERGVTSERMLEVLLDGCLDWMNEYINAEITQYATAAVEQTGRACMAVKDRSVSAKIKEDARIAQNRCMYIAYERFEMAQKAASEENEAECARYLDEAAALTRHTPQEAFVTLVDADTREEVETTASMIRDKIEEFRSFIQPICAELEPMHREYREAFALYKNGDLDQCISILQTLVKRLSTPQSIRLDMPINLYNNRTLLEEVQDTLSYALMNESLQLLSNASDSMDARRGDALAMVDRSIAHLEQVEEGFSIDVSGMKISRELLLSRARSMKSGLPSLDKGAQDGGISLADLSTGDMNARMVPHFEAFIKAKTAYDQDDYETCIPALDKLIDQLSEPNLRQIDKPLSMLGGMTLHAQAEELLAYSHMFYALGMLSQVIGGQSEDGTLPPSAVETLQNVLRHLEEVPRGFYVTIGDQTITRLVAAHRAEDILDASETKPMNVAVSAYMEALQSLIEGDITAFENHRNAAVMALGGLRDEAYVIVTEGGKKYHVSKADMLARVGALSNASLVRGDRALVLSLATFSKCPLQDTWSKNHEKQRKQQGKDEAKAMPRAQAADKPAKSKKAARAKAGAIKNAKPKRPSLRGKPRRASSFMSCIIHSMLLAIGLYFFGLVWVLQRDTFNSSMDWAVAVLPILLLAQWLAQTIIQFSYRRTLLLYKDLETLNYTLLGSLLTFVMVDASAIGLCVFINMICGKIIGKITALPYLIAFVVLSIWHNTSICNTIIKQARK